MNQYVLAFLVGVLFAIPFILVIVEYILTFGF